MSCADSCACACQQSGCGCHLSDKPFIARRPNIVPPVKEQTP